MRGGSSQTQAGNRPERQLSVSGGKHDGHDQGEKDGDDDQERIKAMTS